MKSLVLSTFIASALAVPSQGHTLNSRNALVHRQSAEACSLGFCLENGGTVGGGDATAVVVSDLASFKAAASKKGPSVIIVSGTITGSATDRVDISSDKTVFGEAGSCEYPLPDDAPFSSILTSHPVISGVALRVKGVRNVILRNLKIEKVLYEAGDAIGIDKSTNIWIDHVDLSGDLNSDKTDWDGLLDITHGSDWITVSNSYLHDHVSPSGTLNIGIIFQGHFLANRWLNRLGLI